MAQPLPAGHVVFGAAQQKHLGIPDRTQAADTPGVSAPQIPVRQWTRAGDRVIFDYTQRVLMCVQWPERAGERDFRAAIEERE